MKTINEAGTYSQGFAAGRESAHATPEGTGKSGGDETTATEDEDK
jgi:hypothetical protein